MQEFYLYINIHNEWLIINVFLNKKKNFLTITLIRILDFVLEMQNNSLVTKNIF